MTETSCLATSTAPASHSYKAFSLSSGDPATQNTTYNSPSDPPSSNYQSSFEGYGRNNAANPNTPVSDFTKRIAAVSESCLSTTNYNININRPHSEYIHQSIDDICNKARKLIGKDTFQTSNYELGSKEKAIMSKYISTSDSSRIGFNCDLDYLLRKYSSPSIITNSYNYRFIPGENQYSSYKENDTNTVADDIPISKSSYNSGSNIQIASSASNRHNSNQQTRHERRSHAKNSKRSSSNKSHPILSPSKTNMADQYKSVKSKNRKSGDDESPNNNNVIRFTRCYPDNDQRGIKDGYSSNPISLKKKKVNDATNNSWQCHKPRVPCPVHDVAQTSMSHGQFSGVTNEGPLSVECSCGGTLQEQSNIEQGIENQAMIEEQQQRQSDEPKPTKSKKKITQKKKAGSRHYMINEAKRVYKENELLKAEGMYLRNELECTRKGLIMECAKVLHSVLTFCDEKAQRNKKICHDNVKTTAPKCSCSRMA